MLAGTVALTISPAAPAGAADRTDPPARVHLLAATSASLTVGFRPTRGVRRYRLVVSTVKSDLFVRNIDRPSKHARSVIAHRPRVRIRGLRYTTKPYYYRVAAIEAHHARWSRHYRTAYLRPTAPTSLQAVSGPSGTYLTWQSVADTGAVIEQATDSAFTQHLRVYRTRSPAPRFTPYGLVPGATYYFRVRAVNSDAISPPSEPTTATETTNQSVVKVVSYNSLDASFDGEEHPGGKGAPFAQRRPGQLALLGSSDAAIIGIQEGNSCLQEIPHKPCYRQIDSLAAGLQPRYALADTDASVTGANRYAGNYILYNPAVVDPVGTGGHFILLDHELTVAGHSGGGGRFAAYQVFRVNQTGATVLFVSTHLATPRGHTWDTVRGAETKSMMQQATAYATTMGVGPIVYTGDFNSYPHEFDKVDEPGNAMRAAGYLDGIQVAQTLRNAKYDSINGLCRTPPQGHGSADHVFVSAGVGVQSWQELLHLSDGKLVGTIPSDHNPVVSTIDLPY